MLCWPAHTPPFLYPLPLREDWDAGPLAPKACGWQLCATLGEVYGVL
jgi:hypothetical protein